MTIERAQQAKANAALDMQVCVNGGQFMSRRALVELRVAAGAKVIDRKGERVLMNPDGSWLDRRNITKAGLDYAEGMQAQD